MGPASTATCFARQANAPPRATYTAHDLSDVLEVLSRADEAARTGRWALVMVAYEASPAFDRALRTMPPLNGLPLAWVAIFDRFDQAAIATSSPRAASLQTMPSLAREEFGRRVESAQAHIRAGDTYQVNLTFPLRAPAPADPAELYASLARAQQASYGAMLDLGRHLILSFSPELFFRRRGTRIEMRPMKGTTARGRWPREDAARAAALRTSAKARAENVMIVDLLRNDAGRVARTGSVHVRELFTLERYPTLWQLTSTIEAEVAPDATIVELLTALFPCGSVTGAPKIRTMELIAELEGRARGVYTGAIGLVEPGGDCTFNVAIRTVVVDRATGLATLGVGAGITADSDPDEEYRECLLKAAFASGPPDIDEARFSLLETMRLESGVILRLERHLRRGKDSAEYFGYPWREAEIRGALCDACDAHGAGSWRLRLLIDSQGAPNVECSIVESGRPQPWRVALAPTPVDVRSPFLFNKTTRRETYDAARAARPDVDDVLLWNERGEVTESTIANLVVQTSTGRVTPPVDCGLLPGVFRGELIDGGLVTERVVTKAALAAAPRIWLVNSLRGWIEARLVP